MCGNLSPLLPKEGLGAVRHTLLSKMMIYRMLLFNHPYPLLRKEGTTATPLKGFRMNSLFDTEF